MLEVDERAEHDQRDTITVFTSNSGQQLSNTEATPCSAFERVEEVERGQRAPTEFSLTADAQAINIHWPHRHRALEVFGVEMIR